MSLGKDNILRITDLSWIKDSSQERGRYICVKCGPLPSVMEEVTDPEQIKFLGPGRHRYRCPKCGDIYDSTDPIKRIDEMIESKVGIGIASSNNSTKGAIFEPLEDKTRNDVRGTLVARGLFSENNKNQEIPDPEPDEEKRLRADGFQIKRTEVTSSVTGRKYVKEYR